MLKIIVNVWFFVFLCYPLIGFAELIHFDCIDDGTSPTANKPQQDLANNPPNNLQCLPDGSVVTGAGIVHPDLEIRSPTGNDIRKTRAGATNGTFGAPQNDGVNNNCFEFLDQGRVQVPQGRAGAWGFGDRSVCTTIQGCNSGNGAPVNIDFIFLNNVTADTFSVRMFDWGDLNVLSQLSYVVTLTAYNSLNQVIDVYRYEFNIDQLASPNGPGNQFPGRYTCVTAECFEDPVPANDDLWFDGDACTAADRKPGYINLAVNGSGIKRVEFRMPSSGFDSNVGFDSIAFDIENVQIEPPSSQGSCDDPVDYCKGTWRDILGQ